MYRKKPDLLRKEDLIIFCRIYLKAFSYEDYIEEIPLLEKEKLEIFSNLLLKRNHPAREILLDETVFLLTKSSLISRLKKYLEFSKISICFQFLLLKK